LQHRRVPFTFCLCEQLSRWAMAPSVCRALFIPVIVAQLGDRHSTLPRAALTEFKPSPLLRQQLVLQVPLVYVLDLAA
jgi:hypothetical protein